MATVEERRLQAPPANDVGTIGAAILAEQGVGARNERSRMAFGHIGALILSVAKHRFQKVAMTCQ
jgi:hypothetical protein